MHRVVVFGAVVVTSVCAAVSLAGSAAPQGQATITVRVEIRNTSIALSRRTVPAGSIVRFVVRNRGQAPCAFAIAGKRTRVLARGQNQTVTVRFAKARSYTFTCTTRGASGVLRGTLVVAAVPVQPTPPPPSVTGTISLTAVGTGFERPVFVTAPPGDAERVFVVEQTGVVRIIRDGVTLPSPFLDIRDKVRVSSEPGLLSIAFAPDYETSGLVYVFYNSTAGNGDIHISEFRRHPTDPDLAEPYSERILLTIPKPWENHNGGMLQFGPDGFLYASVGDGDSGTLNSPGFFAQRRDDLLGDMLRIDPRAGDPYGIPADNPFVALDGVRPEIWAYGLRNPWRFWMDGETRAMFIADAGNARREEVDRVSLDKPGANFGWPCFEGSLPFDPTASCEGAQPPFLEYPREGGSCVVIGGVVVRDPRLPALAGRYLYGDFCSGKITAVAVADDRVTASDDLGLVVPELTSFGIDGVGRIYALSLRGDVFRLDPTPPR